ncbi:MAG: hypothetical protein AAFZ01_02190 [Pseudomonadota bacterium]
MAGEQDTRADRLAAALRANLKRRKAQKRGAGVVSVAADSVAEGTADVVNTSPDVTGGASDGGVADKG